MGTERTRQRLVRLAQSAEHGPMMGPSDESRFRHLPEPVRAEELVETVDVSALPVRDEAGEDRDRMLREAGAG